MLPNEWQKSKKQKTSQSSSLRGEKYRSYFQLLIDELREKYHFTGAKAGLPQNWYSFSSGMRGITFGANFAMGGKARTELYIDQGEYDKNKELFDALKDKANEIEEKYGEKFTWERLNDRRASKIALYCEAEIDSADNELEQVRQWHINNLLKIKEVFLPILQELNAKNT